MPTHSHVLPSRPRLAPHRNATRGLALAAVLAAAIVPGLAAAQEATLRIAQPPSGSLGFTAFGLGANGASMGFFDGIANKYYLWSFDQGFQEMMNAAPIPHHFKTLAPDGLTMLGTTGGLPTFWSFAEGMHPLEAPMGSNHSEVLNASQDGNTFVGYVDLNGTSAPARWNRQGSYTTLDVGNGAMGRATAVSFDGTTIVGHVLSSSGLFACAWDSLGIRKDLELPSGLNAMMSDAIDVSADGKVILGRYDTGQGFDGGLWTPTGWQAIPRVEGAPYPFNPEHLSADGQVVSGVMMPNSSSSYVNPFVWDKIRGTRFAQNALLDAGLGHQLEGYEVEQITGVQHFGNGTTMIAGVLRPAAGSQNSSVMFMATLPDAGTFDPIATLQDPSLDASAGALSADGRTVVGLGHVNLSSSSSTTSEIVRRAFVWRKDLGVFDIGTGAAAALGVSGDGGTIVGAHQNGGFRWGSNGGRYLGADALGEAISADGATTVGSSKGPDGVRHAYRWNGARTERYTTYVAGHVAPSHAAGVSGDGAVFVGSTEAHRFGTTDYNARAFRWTVAGTQAYLGDLPGGRVESEALAISTNGSTIVGWSHSKNGPEAFRWTLSGGMKGLGDLPGYGFASRALAVSADGEIVVGSGVSEGQNRACLWDAGGRVYDLRKLLFQVQTPGLDGWTLTAATGVVRDRDGRIYVSGNAVDANGHKQAFHATLPHLPSPTIQP